MKKLITIAAVMMAVMLAKADTYLYWTVDLTDSNISGASYAEIGGYENDTYTSVGDWIKVGGAGDTSLGSTIYTDYLVKLFDSNYNEIAVSTAVNYSEFLSSYAYTSGATAKRPASPYSFSGFVVPEPSSALMLLLGLGALALKRSRLS